MKMFPLRYWSLLLIGVGSVAYAIVDTSPQTVAAAGFDVQRWRAEVTAAQSEISSQLSTVLTKRFAEAATDGTSDSVLHDEEIRLAQLAERSHVRLKTLLQVFRNAVSESLPNASAAVGPEELAAARRIDQQIRLLKFIEILHTARAGLREGADRVQTAVANRSDPSQLAATEIFWSKQRPWLEAELVSMQYFVDGLGQDQTSRVRHQQIAFFEAARLDVQRLIQVALEIENRRIDAWTQWRRLHARSRQVQADYQLFAREQKAALRAYSQIPLAHSHRMTLMAGLRKVASVRHDKR